MDEPLSNLDAKLRVEMRAEIARLQRELEVTTVYVTHDQIEAMTMGTRVLADAGPGLLTAVQDALRSRAARSPVLAAIHLADRVALVPRGIPAGAVGAAVLARRLAAPTAAPPEAPVGSDPQVTAPDAVASDTT